MDSIDRKLLNIIQANFPIARRPFKVLAQELEIAEEEVLEHTQHLSDEGVIRKIGPVFESGKLGYYSALVAAKVPPSRLEEVAETVSAIPSVTHNYGRDSEYNLWFTIICPSEEEAAYTLQEIRSATGINDMHLLPAERVFKIKVDFEF